MDNPDFVDAHVHFYDMNHPDLHYAHWQPDVAHPTLGTQPRRLAERDWLAEDFIAVSRSSNVTKAVHVQAAIGSADPVKETEWLQAAAERTGFPHAIVAYADLRDPNVEAELERHRAFPNMRGIRDFSHGDYLIAPDFRAGFALLEKYGLVASVAAEWQDMENLADLARAFPNVPIVLDHAGLPAERTPEYFDRWRRGMRTAARAENVICKISGLGMGDNRWTVDSVPPVRPRLHRDIRRRAQPVRHQLARRQPVERLRRNRKRVQRDNARLFGLGARGAVLRQRRKAVPHMTAGANARHPQSPPGDRRESHISNGIRPKSNANRSRQIPFPFMG